VTAPAIAECWFQLDGLVLRMSKSVYHTICFKPAFIMASDFLCPAIGSMKPPLIYKNKAGTSHAAAMPDKVLAIIVLTGD
jgi:hypothetical protein